MLPRLVRSRAVVRTSVRFQSTEPWYVSMAKRDLLLKDKQLQKPKVELPANSPTSLKTIATFLQDKLGLTDILVFDLRNAENLSTAVAKLSDFVIISTAKSTKHCGKSLVELNKLIKQQFKLLPTSEGSVNANEERKRLKRLTKKVSLSKYDRKAHSMSQSESWIMVDCQVDSIMVNIFTDQKRADMNLEELYAPEKEKDKYRKKELANEELQPEDQMTVNDQSNVLLGLRRLAMQYKKRSYSTQAAPNKLQEFLSAAKDTDMESLASTIDEKFEGMHNSQILQALSDTVVTSDEMTASKIDMYEKLFNKKWEEIINEKDFDNEWGLKENFSLSMVRKFPKHYTLSKHLNHYLVNKKVSGYDITENEILNFLNLVKQSNDSNSSLTYWDLVRVNSYVNQALKLYNCSNIIDEPKILSAVIDTLVHDKQCYLQSMHQVIDFILKTSEMQHKFVDPRLVSSIMGALYKAQLWSKFWSFWHKLGKITAYENDTRPWAHMIKCVTDSKDTTQCRVLLFNGHLLWLKRNNVIMTDEIKSELKRFFTFAESNNIAYQQLHDLLLKR